MVFNVGSKKIHEQQILLEWFLSPVTLNVGQILLSYWAVEDLVWSGYKKQMFDQYKGVCIVPTDETTTQEG